MKRSTFIFLCLILVSGRAIAKKGAAHTPRLYFIENKGQILDQNGRRRNDIQYALRGQGITVFIGNGQLHYQFLKRHVPASYTRQKAGGDGIKGLGADAIPERQTETYRIDVELAGANPDADVTAENRQPYYETYYRPGCPSAGIQAHTCEKLTYKNIYPGIDWVISIKGNHLEHEFVVGPTGNAADIQLRYHGQADLAINNGGITATTPIGIIREQAPLCYNAGGRLIPSSFKLKGNLLSYEVNASGGVVIDPELEWGTYYGPDSTTTDFYSCTSDDSANIYSCGLTWAGDDIATSGSFQAVYGGGADAVLVKFDSSGNRLWSTYYGGSGGDWGVSVCCDAAGNIYLGGVTQSSLTNIATPGSQQPVYGGGLEDGFLVKFTPAGQRLWGTYCGGTGAEIPGSVACDNNGHVYLGGFTSGSTINIATPGSFMPVSGGGYEDFLEQYDTSGVRQWGTYYGGSGSEFGGEVCTDGIYAFFTGYTSSTNDITTAGCYQPALGGLTDAFLAKFDAAGNRIWGTYYGGPEGEEAGAITCDAGGNIYMLGVTSSDAAMASPGCFQPARAGDADAFLAKFDPELGYRIWGTYYGGPLAENISGSDIITDDSGNVYIGGYTPSTTGIASAGALQPTYGGDPNDGFFAKFNTSGGEEWSTYYGGSGDDAVNGFGYDGKSLYICGETSSPNNIATPGSFQPTGGGTDSFYYCGFLSKIGGIDTSSPSLYAGRGQIQPEHFSIFPNPNDGSFTLRGASVNTDGMVQLTITDVTGKIIMNDEAAILNGTVNKKIISGAGIGGVYFLNVICGDNIHALKFVKQ